MNCSVRSDNTDKIYVITAEEYNGSIIYAGYENSSRSMPMWYPEEQERFAQEFDSVEKAKSWYRGAKKYLDKYYNDNCYPYSVCIQRKIVRCSYHVVEQI